MAKKAEYTDMVRDLGLLGIGLYALTKEKAEKFVKDMQKKGQLNETEGKKLVRKLLADSKKQSEKLEKDVMKLVEAKIKKMPLASQKKLDALEKRVSKLEKAKAKKKKK